MDNITTAMDHHPGNEWMGDTDIQSHMPYYPR